MELAMEKPNELMKKIYDEKREAWKIAKKESFTKQLSTIEDTLSRFDLLKNEIKVYPYLARSGEKKAS